ncbi:MAG: hypothetical protein EHM70_13710 [Chloroflexota bacterium]|nr:MAG: hypothetical protein EHM70_13710 [Chloroflexota bacterium]
MLHPGHNVAYSQGESLRYFPETGHSVQGEFLRAYESVSDPVKLFGYPITEAFQNQTTGRIVQYFQRAHFELHPESPSELRVQFTLLGEILYVPGRVLSLPVNSPACRYFDETEHQVCYAFLQFFENNGGIAQFGYPISEIEIQDDRMIQYFQRARLEWHPEMPAGQRVTLTDLGRFYFDARKEDPARLLPVRDAFIPQSVLELQVTAFLNRAVMPVQGNQTVYAIVQDQNLRPVANAQLICIVKFPSGKESRYVMPLTDEHGVTSLTFSFDEKSMGMAEILISANYSGLNADTRTSFRIWW